MHLRHSLFALLVCLIFSATAFSARAAARLFENVSLIDGVSDAVKHHQSVLVKDGSIEQICDHPCQPTLEGVTRQDYSGHYLLAGLFDMHVHLATSPSGGDSLENAYVEVDFGIPKEST